MNPIWCQMKKLNPYSGQNGEFVHWWLLVSSGPFKQWCFISCIWILLHYLLPMLQHFVFHSCFLNIVATYSCFCSIVFPIMVFWFLCLDYCVYIPKHYCDILFLIYILSTLSLNFNYWSIFHRFQCKFFCIFCAQNFFFWFHFHFLFFKFWKS
jgi:hypothetical protein